MTYLYGRRPVYEALRAGRRDITRLIVAEGGADETGALADVLREAETRGVKVVSFPRDWLDGQARGANHQGVLLEAGPYPYAELADLLRTAEAVGAHGVVIQERRAAAITLAVVSASSGAVEHLRVAQVVNLVRAMEDLKAADVWLAGLDTGPDAVRFDAMDLSGGLGLVVGSEGEGLRRLVRETCDFVIYLPMRGRVESLNAATAGSIALYAAWQARDFRGEW
jgi:23S rRNA (guanosine2251-2'-O)-methyltransferase